MIKEEIHYEREREQERTGENRRERERERIRERKNRRNRDRKNGKGRHTHMDANVRFYRRCCFGCCLVDVLPLGSEDSLPGIGKKSVEWTQWLRWPLPS